MSVLTSDKFAPGQEDLQQVSTQEIKDLTEAFNDNLFKSEQIRQKYQGKSEGMTGQEETEYVGFVNAAFDAKQRLDTAQKMKGLQDWSKTAKDGGLEQSFAGHDGTARDREIAKAHMAAWRKYASGQPEMSQNGWQNTPEYQKWKAYQADDPVGGGFLVPPTQIVQQLLTLAKDQVFIRAAATVFQVPNAETLGVPAVDTDPSDDDWTTELATGSEETTMKFGKRELRPSPMAKQVKVSKKLLRQVPNSDSIILDRMAYKVGITEEKAYLLGSGANQPLGILTAGAQGISTGRDTTTASASAITGDELLNCLYSLKAQYMNRATWVMNRSTILAVRKLKGSDNNYLWAVGVGPGQGFQGQPQTLLSRPLLMSEYVPAIAASTYVAICADLSYYWIADALDLTIQTLYELYATTNQMGYILRKESDGQPVMEEAFARLIMHS